MFQKAHQKLTTFLAKCISPKYFYQHSSRVLWCSTILTIILLITGSVSGLFFAPADYQQGDAFRIIYVHVPAAFLSLAIYSFMTLCALLILVWRITLAEIFLKVSISVGLWMTLLALITGSIWGKPMWGTMWIWDARLTSEFVLFFIYFAILAVSNAIRDSGTSARICSIIVLLGAVDIPIVHYSVNWWNTLHQGSTIMQLSKPSMSPSMLYPLLTMIVGFMAYTFSLIIYRVRTEILMKQRKEK